MTPQPLPRFPALSPASLLFALFLGAVLAPIFAPHSPARDLMALWLAAQEVAAGHMHAIYPPAGPVFTMLPPDGWAEHAAQMGRGGDVFPYLYPPLWVILLAPLTGLTSYTGFASVIFALNLAALILLPQLLARMALGAATGPGQNLLWALLGMAALLLVPGGGMALMQGQPQILVAFLTVLGLERAQNGRPIQGGLALGLAIALKLSPLPLALVWLIAGQWRAGLAALGLASVLGLASLALAGWPLHAEFLVQLRLIERSILFTTAVASLDQLYGILAGAPDLMVISNPAGTSGVEGSSWAVASKPAAYALAQKALMLGLLAFFGLALRRLASPARRTALWLAALGGFAFCGPIGWLYYYLPLYAAPALFLHRFGPRGLVLPLLGLGMVALDRVYILPAGLNPLGALMPSLGILVLIAACLHAAFAPLGPAAAQGPGAAHGGKL